MKKFVKYLWLGCALGFGANAFAASYVIDTKGSHAFIQFKIKHLGFSWLYGRFNRFTGSFEYDENRPEKASVRVNIDTASVDSNHALRDKHLRGDDFLDVDKYPRASFVSTKYIPNPEGGGELKGMLKLHGVEKEITIKVSEIGAGTDPWGGYRRGFSGTTKLRLKDFGIKKNLGPASQEVTMILAIEGIKK